MRRRWWRSACGGSGRWLRSRSGCGGRRRSRCGSVRRSSRGWRARGGRRRRLRWPSSSRGRCALAGPRSSRPAFAASSRASAIWSLVRGRLDSTSQPPGICFQPWRRRPLRVMNEAARPVSPSPAPRTCPAVDLLDVRDGELLPRPDVGMTSSSVGTLGSARKSVLGIDRGGVDSEVAEHGRRGDVERPIARLKLLGTVLPRETDGDEGPVALEGDEGRLAGLDGLAERDHGCPSRWAASCRTRAARRASWAGVWSERDELAGLRRAGVDPDLAVGQVGRLGGHLRRLLLLGRRDDRRPSLRCRGRG